MNDRLGRFGPRELFAVTAVCTLVLGCFSIRDPGSFRDGNVSYFATVIALLLSVLLLRLGIDALKRGGFDGLGDRFRGLPKPIGILLAACSALSMLLAAVLPGACFLRALTDFIYVEATPARIVLYCVPCLAILAALGMETLARTGRVLLPITLVILAVGLGSDVPLYRAYRLFPLLTDMRHLLFESMQSLLRFLPVVLLLLVTAPGAQGWRYVQRAGTRGMLLGGALTVLAEVCLALSYRYTELTTLSSPLYRLVVEIDADNAAVRFDRIALFAWTMAALFGSGCMVYGASLLLAKTCSVRDIRPVAVLLAAAAATAVLLLRALYDAGWQVASLIGTAGAALSVLPLSGLLGRRNRCED